jgi:hypothetical protein
MMLHGEKELEPPGSRQTVLVALKVPGSCETDRGVTSELARYLTSMFADRR